MKRVLYISYDGMTDVLGAAQVLPYLEGLSKAGYEITILSFEKADRFAAEFSRVKAIVDKAKIQWVPVRYTSNPPLLSKAYDLWRLRKMAKRLQLKMKFDLVHCRSYVAAGAGLYLKRNFGVKFLFDMRGFWVEERVDNGQWNLRLPWYRWLFKRYKKLERSFLLEADGIVSLTNAGKNELYRRSGFETLVIDVIPCCADLDHFDFSHVSGSAVRDMRAKLKLKENQRVITYLGSIGGWYMTAEMFTFFLRLAKVNPDFVLLFITKDPPVEVEQAARNAGLSEDMLRVIYSPRAELPIYLSLTDIGLYLIRPCYSKIASSPTKHGEMMGMGIPIICNDIGDTGEMIRSSETGIIINDFQQEEYDRVVEDLDDVLSLEKSFIRKAAFKYFDLREGIERYSRIYTRILN